MAGPGTANTPSVLIMLRAVGGPIAVPPALKRPHAYVKRKKT